MTLALIELSLEEPEWFYSRLDRDPHHGDR
jgi:hypothetical protein